MRTKFSNAPKRAVSILALIAMLSSYGSVFAANKYYVGSGSGLWESVNSWSLTERGNGGAAVPTNADTAIFGYSGGVVTVRSVPDIRGLVLRSVWTGSLLMGTGALIIGDYGFRVGSGRFVGGVNPIAMTGSYAQTGGYVTGIMGTFTLSGSLSVTNGGGTGIGASQFISTGTLIFSGNHDQNFTIGSSVTKRFQNITLRNGGGTTNDDIVTNINGGLSLSGTLTITNGNLDLVTNSVPLVVRNGITLGASAQANLTSNSNITVSGSLVAGAGSLYVMTGTPTLTLNGIDQFLDTNGSPFYNVTISSSSGSTLTSDLTIGGTLTISASSVLGLSGSKLYATGSSISNLGILHEDAGVIVHTGSTLLLADSSYASKGDFGYETAFLTLTDTGENENGTVLDTLTVTLTGGSDSEVITLTETAVASGLFRGSINIIDLVKTVNDGLLEMQSSGTMSLSHTDAANGFSLSDSATFTRPSSATTTTTTSGGGGGRGSGAGGGIILQHSTSSTSSSEVPSLSEMSPPTGIGGELPSSHGKLTMTDANGRTVVFRDIAVSDWFAPFISALLGKGIVSGYQDARGNPLGEFKPGSNVTFGELAKMALNSAGLTVDMSTAPKNRSARGAWSSPYIATLENLGVSTFTESVNVNDPAPRGILVQTIMEVFGKKPDDAATSSFSDVESDNPYSAAIETAAADGIVSGDDGKTTFRPNAAINRAETAKIIEKAMERYGN